MTFRKRDPELITLHFITTEAPSQDELSPLETATATSTAVDVTKSRKTSQFRVVRRQEFIEVLQVCIFITCII